MGVQGEDCMLVSGLIIEDSINIPHTWIIKMLGN